MIPNSTLTMIDGIRVGHAHDLTGPTGCTVILCPPNTIGGVDQRGGAPGTRETDLLHPMHIVEHVHAVLLTGGSAYGLSAADGVMHYLEEQKIGFDVGVGIVPIVPAAVVFDLDLGNPAIRPDRDMGYQACVNATSEPIMEGSVGAGAGVRVGRMMGLPNSVKSGIGSAYIELAGGFKVGALFVVNAIGDIVDAENKIIAGARVSPDSHQFVGSMNILKQIAGMVNPPRSSNTVIGVVATNAQLTKEEVNKMAQMAQDGIAQAVRPAHTMMDGDTIFGLATSSAGRANISAIGAFAAEATAEAIRRAVQQATSLAGLPSITDLG